LVDLLSGVDRSDIVREVSAGDPFFNATSVLFELQGGLQASGLSALSVRAEWGVGASAADGAPCLASGEALLDPGTSSAHLAAGVSSAVPYRWRAHATYLAGANAPRERTSEWRDAVGQHQYFDRGIFPVGERFQK